MRSRLSPGSSPSTRITPGERAGDRGSALKGQPIAPPAGRAFADIEVALQYRVYTDPANRGPWIDAVQGETFSVTGPDGRYFVDVRSADPCHPFVGDAAEQTFERWLDA